jgi:hypothetical protein
VRTLNPRKPSYPGMKSWRHHAVSSRVICGEFAKLRKCTNLSVRNDSMSTQRIFMKFDAGGFC